MLRFSDEAVVEWVPIVQALVARGICGPAELVFTLAYREFELESATVACRVRELVIDE